MYQNLLPRVHAEMVVGKGFRRAKKILPNLSSRVQTNQESKPIRNEQATRARVQLYPMFCEIQVQPECNS
jgi:hypothetical protein